MASKKEIGDKGESIATDHLIKNGYQIIERNWRFSRAEIDIICKKDDCLVFVEVKSRAYTFFGEPSDSVGSKKIKLMMDASNEYMKKQNYEWKFRFDIISIVMKDEVMSKLEHFEDAFFPGW